MNAYEHITRRLFCLPKKAILYKKNTRCYASISAKTMKKPITTISGIIKKGSGRGKKIGFPTINIPTKNQDIPHGVYIVSVNTDNTQHNGVANIGPAPTFDRKEIICEVHLFNTNKNMYGDMAKIKLIKHIRPVQKFNSKKELISQIKKDTKEAQLFFNNQNHV